MMGTDDHGNSWDEFANSKHHTQVLLIWSWVETHPPHRTHRYHPDRIFGGNHQLLSYCMSHQKWTNGCEKISHKSGMQR